GGYWLEGEQTVVDISNASRRDPQIRKAARKLDIALPGRPTIALAVGQDFRRWAKADERGGRADTVMLMRADPDIGTLSMLSFPRDLLVEIHCPGRAPFLGRRQMSAPVAPTRSCSCAPTRTSGRSRCSRSRATSWSRSTVPGAHRFSAEGR